MMTIAKRGINFIRSQADRLARKIATVKSFSVKELDGLECSSGLGDSAWLLYALTRSYKPEVCVEIGSAQGKSACYIGVALKKNGMGRLYAIDPHTSTDWNDVNSVDSYEIIIRNLRKAGVSDQVEIVRQFSTDVAKTWNRPIDILFIDGDHSYEGVKHDWDAFSPHVSPFGIVVFHDTIWDVGEVDENYQREDMGVPRFVDELRQEGYQVLTIPNDYGVSLVQPVLHGNPLQ